MLSLSIYRGRACSSRSAATGARASLLVFEQVYPVTGRRGCSMRYVKQPRPAGVPLQTVYVLFIHFGACLFIVYTVSEATGTYLHSYSRTVRYGSLRQNENSSVLIQSPYFSTFLVTIRHQASSSPRISLACCEIFTGWVRNSILSRVKTMPISDTVPRKKAAT